MNELKLFKCLTCGNIVEMVVDKGVPLMCCGKPVELLVPNTSDGAGEKHVPVVEVNGNKVVVKVGEVEHPMVEAHYIQFIYVETNKGIMKKYLKPEESPVAMFELGEDERVIAVYEYCNLHGLWKTEL